MRELEFSQEDLARIKYNPVLFQKTFFKISDADKGVVPYNPYPYQQKITNDPSNLVVINKARQIGISTSTVCDALYRAMIIRGYKCVFISQTQDQAWELINKAREIIHNLPDEVHVNLSADRSGLLKLSHNGSQLKAVSSNPKASRGLTGDLFLDEFAHVPDDRAILTAAMQCTVRGGLRIRMLSTPYGNKNEYARICREAKAGNNWAYHVIHWSECPDLTEERINERCYTHEMRLQEYENQFLDDATAMVTWEMLDKACDKELEQYSLSHCPINTHNRFIGIDPGEKRNETGFIIAEKIDNHWFVRYVYARGMDKNALISLATAWYDKFRPTKIYIDATGAGAPIASDLESAVGTAVVERMVFSPSLKEKLVYNLVGLFDADLLHLPNNEKLKSQLHALERGKSVTGVELFTGKSSYGAQDDLVWALALAVCHNMVAGTSLRVEVIPIHQKSYRRGGEYEKY